MSAPPNVTKPAMVAMTATTNRMINQRGKSFSFGVAANLFRKMALPVQPRSKHGQNKMTKTPAICVFCGASFGDKPLFAAVAVAMGVGIAGLGAKFVFGGGGPGLMGEAARGARDAGGTVEGILPGFLRDMEPPLDAGEDTEIVPDLFVRKREMIARSDAFVTLPGGLGTYDEFFEVLTAAQLGVHAKPIILVNVDGYFDALDAMIRGSIARGFARDTVLALYQVADSADDALARLKTALKL
jgi:uncharacterized protein (TIGR00730 family)